MPLYQHVPTSDRNWNYGGTFSINCKVFSNFFYNYSVNFMWKNVTHSCSNTEHVSALLIYLVNIFYTLKHVSCAVVERNFTTLPCIAEECIHGQACCRCNNSCERDWTVPVQSRSRQVAVAVLLMSDAVDTVTWDPDDGWRYHPKHVDRFTDINKLCIVASCWTVIGI